MGETPPPHAETRAFMKTKEIQDCPKCQHFIAYHEMSYVNMCVAKSCNSIYKAPRRCDLSPGSHSSGLEYDERTWKTVYQLPHTVESHVHVKMTYDRKHTAKTRFSWVFLIIPGFS